MSESASSEERRIVLAIDTATDSVVVGIATVEMAGSDDGPRVTVMAQRVVADGRRHAEITTTLMAECIAEAGIARSEIHAVVAGTGPGPFTGLRVGMATGAGFGDALGIPVYGVCSLDAIAYAVSRAADHPSTTLVVTDARRREVYWAAYREGRRTSGPQVAAPASVAAELADMSIDAAGGSPAHLELVGKQGVDTGIAVPTVGGLVSVAAESIWSAAVPAPLVPLYLRRPDAVERKDQRAKTVSV